MKHALRLLLLAVCLVAGGASASAHPAAPVFAPAQAALAPEAASNASAAPDVGPVLERKVATQ
ncbi:MAG: hypothetical protein AAFR54_18450, partial [Planctomycetota bacterium]